MNYENFAYWLNGYVEITNPKQPTEDEWLIIKDHLKLVFNKVTPYRVPLGTQVPYQPTPVFDQDNFGKSLIKNVSC